MFVTIFTLAIHLMGEVGIVQETAPYLLAVYALTLSDIPVREAICEAAQKFALKRPGSKYSPNGLFGRAAQVHVGIHLSYRRGRFADIFSAGHRLNMSERL